MPSTVFVTPNEQIAVGNNNAAGLALVTSLIANSVPFFEVTSLARWQRGQPAFTTIGTKVYSGFASVAWESSFVTLQQWEYLKDTYEGLVTIKTLTDDDDTYANYNAILNIGDLTDYTDNLFWHTVYGKGIQDFRWIFTRLVAL
jgi:hypothetical protein